MKINDSIYKVDYDSPSDGILEWVVRGPATYIRFGKDRNQAYDIASRLNTAYLLGYATQIIESQNDGNGTKA